MAETINLVKCPSCDINWIEDSLDFCPACEIQINTDLLIHDLVSACNALSELDKAEIARHRANIQLLSDKLKSLIL
jgi:hypothetical protein